MWLIKHQHYNNFCDKPIVYLYHCSSLPLPLSQGDAHGQQHQSLLAGKSNAFLSAIFPFGQSVYLLFHESVSPPSLRIRKSQGRWQAISGGASPLLGKQMRRMCDFLKLGMYFNKQCCWHFALSEWIKQVSSTDFLEVKYFTIRNSLYDSIYNCSNNKKNCETENAILKIYLILNKIKVMCLNDSVFWTFMA